MNDYLLYGIVALIVIIVLAIVFTYIIKNRHPKQIKAGDIPLDIKNEEVNIQLNKRAKELNLVFVTPSLYKIHNQKDED